MVSRVHITQSSAEHVRLLGHSMRAADAREATALGVSPHQMLYRSYKASIIRQTAFVGDEIAAMWGIVGSPLGASGCPWLVTGPAAEKIPSLTFARIYKKQVREMLKVFPVLENYVDATYHGAIRMLEIAGASVGGISPIGPKHAAFRQFRLKA